MFNECLMFLNGFACVWVLFVIYVFFCFVLYGSCLVYVKHVFFRFFKIF